MILAGPPPRTEPAACAWETAVWADPVKAVGIIDGLLRAGSVSRSALASEAARNSCRPGGRRAAWVFGLTDGLAQSPPESHLRVRLVFAGLPRPVAQHPVRVSTGLILHPDLAWPEFRVAVEYDGQWHSDADRMHLDRRRLNQLVEAGWLVLHVTGRRLHKEFPALVREIRAALVARGWRP
ncbi:endonuclease domain-containing protein [Micromonospora chalcea]|uniref:endonuclease domain-containing protein n=1 Tax=Micromonospora chalcea TaxID=1874 RepID=UPI0037A894AC